MGSIKRLTILPLLLILTLSGAGLSLADDHPSCAEAFQKGEIGGTIGSYFEFTDREAPDSNTAWATGYLSLKYETLEWKRFQWGAGLFAHGQLANDAANGTTNPFKTDVEDEVTFPEFYFNLRVAESSGIRVGRWDHRKISHFDDAQSEGAYVQFKEIEGLEVAAGFMTRFAEIDYDDGEDFGRGNDAQDLSSDAVYGAGSKAYLIFADAIYQATDTIKLNPYVIVQDGYAGVVGMDTHLDDTLEDHGVDFGGCLNYYHVDARKAGTSESDNWVLKSYVKKGPFKVSGGFAQFSDDDALNKPAWLRDYFVDVDQLLAYANAGCGVWFGKIKYSKDKFWTHVAFADYDYSTTALQGDGSLELELQFGYKFTKAIDANIRLFDVSYDNIDDKDYQKLEGRIRYRF